MTRAPLPAALSEWQPSEILQTALDAFTEPVFVKDRAHRWVACNSAFCEIFGQPRNALIGRTDTDFMDAALAAGYWRNDDEVFTTGQPNQSEEIIEHSDGSLYVSWTRKYPIRNQNGDVIGLIAWIADITELKRRETEIARLQEEAGQQMAIVEMQRRLLDEVTVPVIRVWDGILLLPLAGAVESRRAVRITETMLESIGRLRAQVVIIDITGVPVVDTGVASHLIRAVQAAQLLGCESILVGISPEIAQTLVGLGIDFSRIHTRATLQNGLEHALTRLSYVVQRPRA